MREKSLSVVVPCYNESRTIYENIKKIHSYLSGVFEIFEIIAVNDGSKDDTLAELQKAQKEIPLKIIDNVINEGKGKVVKDGILASQNEIVMFLDADLGIPVEETEKFAAEIENGASLAIASRFVPGYRTNIPVLWYRKFMEKVFRLMRMVILNNYAVKDTQCGFKMFTREAARKIFPRLRIKRFAFDSEIIFIARKNGYKIKELPIALQNPPRSSVRIFRDPLNMALDLFKIRLNYFFGRYKAVK